MTDNTPIIPPVVDRKPTMADLRERAKVMTIPAEGYYDRNIQRKGLPPSVTTGEVRSISATGGEKGVKPERYDLIPIAPLDHLARVYGKGALKYDDHNWRRGYEWGKSYAALQRHLTAFWEGEDIDEDGEPHLAHAAWHCFTLLEYLHNPRYAQFDDRYKEPV